MPILDPMHRALRGAGRLLLLAAACALLIAWRGAQAQNAPSLYLPLVRALPQGLYGTVTFEGRPAAGIWLQLYAKDAQGSDYVASATTDSSGLYQFVGVPAPSGPASYSVFFGNGVPAGSPYAAFCETDSRSGYDGRPFHLTDFDIDAIEYVTPADGASVSLPAEFRWRRDVAGGTYTLIIQAAQDGMLTLSPYHLDVQRFTLDSLPPGFSYNTPLDWYVQHRTDQALCMAKQKWTVSFTP